MYVKKDREAQRQMKIICIEELVPHDHLLRLIDQSIHFDFIYDEVKGLYSELEWGKPGIDPVSLFKIVFIQHLYGIRSMRQTIKDIEVNMAYRWFIGYDLGESIPHFSTFGKNYSRRFQGTDVFQRIFEQILQEAIRCGFVDAQALFIDGTHIKASANRRKATQVVVEKQAKRYQKQLEEEIERDRAEHGKKPLKKKGSDDDSPPPQPQRPKRFYKAKWIRKAGCFIKESTRNVSRMWPIQPAISITLSWTSWWEPEISMTASCLTTYTKSCCRRFPRSK